MMNVYHIEDYSDTLRAVWVYDEYHETRGSFWTGDEAETKEMEDAELAALEDGSLVALGCIIQTHCASCDEWTDKDSLWGIVIEPRVEKLREFAAECMDWPDDEG